MSTALVREQITAFLASPDAEVLCIRGNWGTGKTYTWKRVLEEAARKKEGIALEKYAAVSLFGLNSVADVRQELIHETIPRDHIGKEFDPEDVKSLYREGLAQVTRGASWLGRVWGEGYVNAGVSLMSLFVRKRLICIDDLERKGEGLRSADVLGLISHLKEERDCKIVLLLNDEQLEDKNEFDGYLEKVVDINLRFAPTATESAEIALSGEKGEESLKAIVRTRTIKLGIDNIRVIRKVFRSVAQIQPLLVDYQPAVLHSVATTLVLFGWSYHQPELAPPLEYLKSLGEYLAPRADGQPDPDEPIKTKWSKIIRDYGYSYTDDFDRVLLDGILNGYFDKEIIDGYAKELNLREQTGEANRKLDEAWDVFRNSFDSNLDELEKAMRGAFYNNMKYYNLSSTTQAVQLLRRVGSVGLAEEIFSKYLEVHKDTDGAFDLDRLHRFGQELPADLKERLEKAQHVATPDLSVDEMFLALKEDGFGSATAAALAKLPIAEYVRVLKSHNGEKLRQIRDGLTNYINVVNPNESSIIIMDKTGEALKKIAEESPLNDVRANAWGLIQRLDNVKGAGQRLLEVKELNQA